MVTCALIYSREKRQVTNINDAVVVLSVCSFVVVSVCVHLVLVPVPEELPERVLGQSKLHQCCEFLILPCVCTVSGVFLSSLHAVCLRNFIPRRKDWYGGITLSVPT